MNLYRYQIQNDIQRIFYPINLAFTLLCASQYKIRNNVIIPIGIKNIFIWFSLVIIILILFAFNMYRSYYNEEDAIFSILSFLRAFYVIYCFTGYSMIFVSKVVNRSNSCRLIMMLQYINYNINSQRKIDEIIICNWVYAISTFTINIFAVSIFYALCGFDVINVMFDFSYINFDINIVHAICILMMLTKYLNEWIKSVAFLEDQDVLGSHIDFKIAFQTYDAIIQTYNLSKNLFEVLLSLMLLTFNWFVKNMIILVALSIYCEKFYIKIEEARIACAKLLKKTNYSNHQMGLYKKVLQTNRTCSKMTACGLFYIDAKLPIYLFLLITNHLIVLLQFYFLITVINKKIMTMWFVLAITICGYRSLCSDIEEISENVNVINVVESTYSIFVCFGFVIMLIVELKNRQNNCSIVTLFHKIHSSIKLSNQIHTLIIFIWFLNFTIVLYNLLIPLLLVILYTDISLITLLSEIAYITFEINLVYAISMLMLLNK
ncbi:hypothetical protein SFRURICE_017000 [Spodoptera frugiperda]|nr:hypothetical protein SFRURICE_017000 [Spodoptera frugiperda]